MEMAMALRTGQKKERNLAKARVQWMVPWSENPMDYRLVVPRANQMARESASMRDFDLVPWMVPSLAM